MGYIESFLLDVCSEGDQYGDTSNYCYGV